MTSTVAVAVFTLSFVACRSQYELLSDKEKSSVLAVKEKYRTEWLKNNADGVVSVFSDDAVLLPPNGVKPVEGKQAIKAYWFPPADTLTIIDEFVLQTDELYGVGDLAYERGISTVTWHMEHRRTNFNKAYISKGSYVTIYRRVGHAWKMKHQIWDAKTTELPR
jgi:ketosteroid isomerase-like protein